MTSGELIKILEQLPPDAEVRIESGIQTFPLTGSVTAPNIKMLFLTSSGLRKMCLDLWEFEREHEEQEEEDEYGTDD